MNAKNPPLDKRIGPRPLGLHLGLASSTLASSLAVLPFVRDGQYPWLPELQSEAEDIKAQLQAFDLDTLITELGMRGHQRVQAMISGIQKYHAHPYCRTQSDADPVWTKGSARLLDYAPDADKKAPIAFIVPSLVNKGYILDLKSDRSFVRGLAEQGIRPLLMDWGNPGEDEQEYSLDDYVLEILVPALDQISAASPEAPLHLIGYCMGGTIAVAQAQYQQEKLTSLIALAVPWNFQAGLSSAAQLLLSQDDAWQAILDGFGEMPVDLLQAFFANLDPNLCMNKFGRFDRMDLESRRAIEFVALEDWLNDGVPLVKKVAAECFSSWYGANSPYLGDWFVGGDRISPQNLTIPAMVAVPKSDKIVPPESALGLAEQIPNATVLTPPSGHIGMVAGSRAKDGLWADVIRWINC